MGSFSIFAQGTVNFGNGQATLVSAGVVGQQAVISGPRDSYYFGLLIAPPGSMSESQFSFAGIYATNVGPASPGIFWDGLGVPVPTWAPGKLMSFMVAGWSSSLGHDWNQSWLGDSFSTAGYFGFSSIATGTPGGAGGGVPFEPLTLFGGATGIQTGWNLDPVAPIPEPSTNILFTFGAALSVFGAAAAKGRKPPASG